jgi:hypothetical protein
MQSISELGMSVVNEELKHVEDAATAIWEALQECGFKG